MTDQVNTKAFPKILSFLKELKDAFGDKFPELAKYYNLCKKTTFDNSFAINKQAQLFKDYCLKNQAAIKASKWDQLSTDDIEYNNKFSFNIRKVVASTKDVSTQQTIMKYLQVIMCIVHPDEELKLALTSKSKEEELFDNLIGNLEKRYENTQFTNVSEAMDDMKNNGMMEDISTTVKEKLEKGELDVNKLLGGAFKLFDKIKSEATDPTVSSMMSMVEGMMNQAKMSLNNINDPQQL